MMVVDVYPALCIMTSLSVRMVKEKLTQKTEELNKSSVKEQITLENTNSTDYFEPVEKTPFTIIKGENDLYFGVCGDIRVTKFYENKEELRENLKTDFSWERITNVIVAIAKRIRKIEENE